MLLLAETLKVDYLKTYFIGIDLDEDEDALKQLIFLHMLGGENVELHTTKTIDIEKIF